METKIENTLAGGNNKEKKIGMIRANFAESDTYRNSSGFQGEEKSWHDLYMGIPPSGKQVWMSNIFIPMVMSKVDAALSSLIEILFQIKPPIEVKVLPYGKGDAFHAGIIKTLLAKQTDNDNFFLKMVQYLKNLLIYGTSIGYVCWDKSSKKVTRKIKEFEPMIDYNGNDLTAQLPEGRKLFKGYNQQTEVIVNEGPMFEPCNIGDVYPDPQSIEVNDGYLIWKIRRSIAHLRENMKSDTNPYGMYNDEVMKLRKEDSCEVKEGKQNIEGSMGRQWDMPVTREDLATMVDIIYWFGKYDTNDDGKQENCIMALAANKYLIRDDADIYWHGENGFVKGGYSLKPNEFYHMGIGEQLEGLNNNMNEVVNQRIDNVQLCLNPIAEIDTSKGVRSKDVVMSPGGVIPVDGENGVKWNRAPDVTQGNFAHVSDLERWMQEVSVPKITSGITGGELNQTATGMGILAQGAMDKSMLIAKIVESTSFSKILKLFYELDYQMMDEYQIAKVIGMDEPQKIDMEKMNPDYYDILPAGVKSMGDKNQKALKILQAMNIFKGQPWFKEREAGTKFMELMAITDNPNELVRTEEETAEIELNKQKEEAAKIVAMMAMGNMAKNPQGTGPGRESTQFSGGETNLSTPGVPPNTTPNAPEPEIGSA